MLQSIGIENFLTFAVAATIFVLTPGLDTLFILNKCITQGKRAGIHATMGINTGVLVHTFLAALGLSLVIARSVLAFAALKYFGAAYLLYLGVSKIISRENTVDIQTTQKNKQTAKQNFISGLINNVLNPKVALFVLAFFPQFVKRESISSPVPFIFLGVTYAVLGLTWLILLTLFASAFSKKLGQSQKANTWLNRFSGITFILMGVKVALSKR